MIGFFKKEMKKNKLSLMIKTVLFCLGGKKGTTLFFHLSYLILLSKIQCNNSLQSTSEQHQQQKNMCFKQNVTISLYKK